MATQRQDFERQVAKQNEEMELQIARKVEAAIQAHQAQQPPPPSASFNSDPEFKAFLANQNRQMQMLTDMMFAQPMGKRFARVADSDVENTIAEQGEAQSPAVTFAVRKRQNTRATSEKIPLIDARLTVEPGNHQQMVNLSDISMDQSIIQGQLQHRTEKWSPDSKSHHWSARDPESPLDPFQLDYPSQELQKDPSFDSSAIQADRALTPPPRKLYEARPGIFADAEVSDDHFKEILQQHSEAPKVDSSHQLGDSSLVILDPGSTSVRRSPESQETDQPIRTSQLQKTIIQYFRVVTDEPMISEDLQHSRNEGDSEVGTKGQLSEKPGPPRERRNAGDSPSLDQQRQQGQENRNAVNVRNQTPQGGEGPLERSGAIRTESEQRRVPECNDVQREQGRTESTSDHTRLELVETNSPRNIAQTLWKDFFKRHSQPVNSVSRRSALSVQNQKENKHWGDVLTEKTEGVTRIYSQNVNGINLDRRGGKFNAICELLREIQGDIFCGQEHNLDTSQANVRQTLYDTTRQHWERSLLTLGTTPIAYHTQYKPGGTFTLATGHITGRILAHESDKWGRWTIQHLTGKADRKVAIFSVYQVVDKSVKGGITTARQQQVLLIQDNDAIQEPRTAFRRDLHMKLRNFRSKGYELLVLGDFNEEFGSDSEGMEFLASDLGLVNLIPTKHPQKLPATYARGRSCLDYALATQKFQEALVKAGYEAFNHRLHSDHRGFYLDFQNSILSARLSLIGNRHEFAERLDKDVLNASLTAERKTHRYREPFWSVELAEARKKVTILSKCLSSLKTGLHCAETLTREIHELNDPISLPTSIRDCSSSLRKAKQDVKQIVSQSYQRRDAERMQKIKALENSRNPLERKVVASLRRLKKVEDIKHLFRKLKNVRSSNDRYGVTRLEIPVHPEEDPKVCTEWQQIDVPEEILRHLTRRNQQHFGQAQGTPFTTSPLAESLGFGGGSWAGDDLLNGQFDTQGMDENVSILIRHIRHIEEMQQLASRPTISDDEFVQKLKVWTESTTTSPSGFHLGHYKALIGRHSHSIDARDDELPPEFVTVRNELDQKQRELREVHLRLLNYALERGYSYRRWHTVANVILFKDPGVVKIHRTRVIHLYEADYNLALGIKWRSALHQAEDLRRLDDGQYGSRPKRNAKDPVLLEELQYEISRITRKSLAITSYDAMACYDRIIPSVAMLAVYRDPSGEEEVTLGITGFVDDCGSQITDQGSPSASPGDILQGVQYNAQLWTNLLSASGGALEISKCSCHVVQWQFSQNGSPVFKPVVQTSSIKVEVTDPITNVTHSVKLLSPYQAHKTLGHHKDPAGTQQAQFRELKAKSDEITKFMWSYPLSRSEAWTYYYACYLPSVMYPLAASSMTKHQVHSVQRKALSILVARCGYNRNTKREILFGPASLGGATFRDLYVEQGIAQISSFIHHWRQYTTIGKMLRITVAWIQVSVGVSYSILENVVNLFRISNPSGSNRCDNS
ncbi:hypothetical protein MHU86_22931 [Fragilaria crotonensis]|nr:hypothetical protein MHU86_22931 [Fragilaria crotonensis]